MKLSRLSALAAASVLAFAPCAMADGNTIGVVNIQQITTDSAAAKSVHEQMESKYKTYQSEISKKEEDLRKEDQDLAKERGVLSKDAFDKKAESFRKKVTDAQKETQSKKALLDNASARAWADIQKVVNDIVADIAKSKGLSVVIPTQEALFADPKLDITSDVLSQLNKKLPKFDVKFDAEK